MIPTTLAYVESSLPAVSQAKRLAALKRYGIALEIANQEDTTPKIYQQAQIPIAAVQAYQLHNFHPLHHDPSARQQAQVHVFDTLELAARLQCPRIVTVCGFGHDLIDSPFEQSLAFFASVADRAQALGVRVMIEPLSPQRAEAMTHPEQVVQLLKCLDQPAVFSLLLDTGHLLDSGFELTSFFATWQYPIEELQLKGSHSAAPDFGLAIAQWLAAMATPPQVICVEHRQSISWAKFEQIVKSLQAL